MSQDTSNDLDGDRIHKIALLRRSLWRSRSHWLMALILCIAAGGQSIWMGVSAYHRNNPAGAIIWSIAALICGLAGVYCARQAAHYAKLAQTGSLTITDLSIPSPDSSALAQLSDGSQRWKSLETLGKYDPSIAPNHSSP